MVTTEASPKTIVSCLACGAILGAERTANGSFVPLGSSDACACGNATEFRRLR